MDYSFTYLFGELLMFLPTFVLCWYLRKDLRREMLVAGLTFGAIAFLTEPLFIKYYWHPEYIYPLSFGGMALGSFEDFLYGFLKGAVAAVLFEVLWAKRFRNKKMHSYKWKHMVLPVFGAAGALFIAPVLLWDWNPIYTSVFCIMVFSIPLLMYREDLIPEAFISGVLLMALSFLGFKLLLLFHPDLISAWWKLDNLSGFLLSGVPIEEMLESFVVGFFGGPFYEFWSGLRLKKYRPSLARS